MDTIEQFDNNIIKREFDKIIEAEFARHTLMKIQDQYNYIKKYILKY